MASAVWAAPDSSLPPRLNAGPAASAPVLLAQASSSVRAYPPRLKGGRGGAPAQTGLVAISGVGAVCGTRALQGERLRPFNAGGGCAMNDPVRLHSVEGVALEPEVVVDCETAGALREWVRDSAVPSWGRLGRGLGAVNTGDALVCTGATENPGAHAAGRAVDVTGFRLKNGITRTVREHWGEQVAGQVMRKTQEGGCKAFGYGLGPGAGAAYRDRLHFETGSRQRLCR